MKILFDARPVIHDYAGVGNYVYHLLKGFAASGSDIKFDILSYDVSKKLLDFKGGDFHYKTIKHKLRKLYAASFDFFNLPLMDLLFGKYDAIHQTFFACLPTTSKQTKIISTIHDVIFLSHPEYFTRNNLIVAERALERQLKYSDTIIAVSNFTKNELISKCGCDADKITVIYEAASLPTDNIKNGEIEKVKNKFGIAGRYVLFIGTIEPRKNLIMLFRAFSMIKDKDCKLVVVGKKGWYYEQIFDEVRRLKLEHSVVFTGYVSLFEKAALLSGAEIFVFPSICEGFGIPVIEAMSFGLSVIAGNNSTMPELIGEAGVLVNILDANELADKINWLLDDGAYRLKLSTLARNQAMKFSWEKTVGKTLALYKKVVQ